LTWIKVGQGGACDNAREYCWWRTMPAHNTEIADALDQVADLLELEHENSFRIRAYRNAARVMRGRDMEVTSLFARGETMPKICGIGAALAGKIKELATGEPVSLLDQLRRHVPAVALELLRLPNLGPKRVKLLCKTLHIHSLEQLHRALLDGRVRALPGFGARMEKKLIQAIAERPHGPSR
jgi:DNA polymerase (family 10)